MRCDVCGNIDPDCANCELLGLEIRLLPTPTTQDGANTGGASQFGRNTLPLNARVLRLAE